MKKFFIGALALVAAAFTSCSNEDLNIENNEVKVNFTVADKDGFGANSRAVKTEWANGDKILIFLAANNNNYTVLANANNNTITLSYNGSTWTETIGTLSEAITNVESTGGKYTAVHYRGDVAVGDDFRGDALLANYVGGEYMTCEGTYTKIDDTIELGKLTLKYPNNAMYVSIPNIAGLETLDWKLAILDENYNSGWIYDDDYFAADAFMAGDLFVANQHAYIRGISNEDGSSFVENDSDWSFFFVDKVETSTKYTFYLYATNYGPYTYTTTTPVVGNKAYSLPELILDDDKKPTTECKWVKQ